MEEDKEDLVLSGKKDQIIFKVPSFEGPLDLLLHLITQEGLDIYEIPIAKITEQFLVYIKEHRAELGDMAEFYKMAADLLYIKSRMLLPVEVEFDEEYEDPRQELIDRLLEYQKFKKYTDLLTGAAKDGSLYIPRKEGFFAIPFTDQDLFKDIGLKDLLLTYSSLLEHITPNKLFNVYEEVTVNEKIALLEELFESQSVVTIEQLIVHMDKPLHVICAFMAILETTKFRMTLLKQQAANGQILIMQRPAEYDEKLASEYDKEYDEIVENKLEDPDDFSIINKSELSSDAQEELKEEEKQEEEAKAEERQVLGEEEELLEDEDDNQL